jgi:hypothetical protein
MIYDKGLLDIISPSGPRSMRAPGRMLISLFGRAAQAGRSRSRARRHDDGGGPPQMGPPQRLADGRMLLPVPRGVVRSLRSRG